MKVETFDVPGPKLLVPVRHGDNRGYFSEVFNTKRFAEAGVAQGFIQDNQSLSAEPGTVRGLHCQVAPFPQGKLVRCIQGAVWDVAVDIRAGSPTYGKWVSAQLSAENGAQLWVPAGFLHGFCTTAPDTVILYKVTHDYDRDSERGVIWDDKTLSLPWPVAEGNAVLSGKDKELPAFEAARGWFPA